MLAIEMGAKGFRVGVATMTLLVIDIGSSSVRTLLYTDDARLIGDSVRSRKHDIRTGSDGRATVDAAEIRALVETCMDEALAHPAAKTIRAVGMASFVGNWLGLDEAGEACMPTFTYADTRSGAEIPALLAKLDGDTDPYHQATGCMLHPAYLPPQYAHLQHMVSGRRSGQSDAFPISAATSTAPGSAATRP